MAKIVKEEEFKNKIVNATKKIVGVGALAFLMTGCQSTMDYTPQDMNLTNKSKIENIDLNPIAKVAPTLEKINGDNYEEIVSNNKSGVYQHPVYKDQVITYEFNDDIDSDLKIKKQLEELGISPEAYDIENGLYELVTSDSNTQSRHVQNPFGDESIDINLSKIFNNNYTEIDDLSDEERPEYEKNQKYDDYHLLMHEAGHSLKHQQMKTYDFLSFDKNVYVMLENSAESFAIMKTVQLLHEKGETHESINKFTEYKLKSGIGITENVFDRGFDVHQYVPSLNIISDLVKTDLDYILDLTDEQIDGVSEVIAKEAVNFDYAKIYNSEFNEELEEDSMKILKKLKQNSKKTIDHLSEQIDNQLEDPKTKRKYEKNEDLKKVKIILDTISENQKEFYEYGDIDYIQEKALEKANGMELSSLKIYERDIVGIKSYKPLHEIINKKLEERGLPVPNDIFNLNQEMKELQKNNDLDSGLKKLSNNKKLSI
tara:strand:- start:20224 stop:21678 length:1455 start_codon:yes stop_codon:yes gene_type:complete